MEENDRESPAGNDSRTTDRRTFLRKAGVAAGIGIGAYITGLPEALAASRVVSATTDGGIVVLRDRRAAVQDSLSLDSFSAARNTRFSFQSEDGVVHLVLNEATRVPSRAQADTVTDCFSLIFSGPSKVPLEQGVYAVSHAGLGRFDIFLVPMSDDGRTRLYQAVFNRLPQNR